MRPPTMNAVLSPSILQAKREKNLNRERDVSGM